MEHRGFVELVGERELDEDAVDQRIGVVFGDLVHDGLGISVGGVFVFGGMKSGFLASFVFAPHIGVGSRVVADENGPEARGTAEALFQVRDLTRDLGPHLRGDRLSVDDSRRHDDPSIRQ